MTLPFWTIGIEIDAKLPSAFTADTDCEKSFPPVCSCWRYMPKSLTALAVPTRCVVIGALVALMVATFGCMLTAAVASWKGSRIVSRSATCCAVRTSRGVIPSALSRRDDGSA